jgi:hypothetical protein
MAIDPNSARRMNVSTGINGGNAEFEATACD